VVAGALVLDRAALPADPQFRYVGLHEGGEAAIYREDVHGQELRLLSVGGGEP